MPTLIRPPIDWPSKLRHLLQALAFSVAVASLEQAFTPDKPFAPSLVYSLLIGASICSFIDIGRHLVPSAAETGWPTGWGGVVLVMAGILTGFVVGKAVGDAICRSFQLFPPGHAVAPVSELRSAILITLIAGAVGSYWFYSRHTAEYLLRKMHEAEQHAEEARLKLLQTQLEPHMLFNTLANLRALIGVDPPRAQEMLDHMIAYLRATLDASRGTTHPLQAEFERLRDYLELMKIRMGSRLAYELQLPPELAGVCVPTLLLQPLVENSVQHGLEPKVQGGRIVVSARRAGGRLLLEVTDTGAGSNGGPSGGKGFGMSQVRQRLQSLHGQRAALEFASDEAGAHARITLPAT